ncbi:MAG TPA: OmpH family outer membrane protein [bacterium]|nr:OmpH family outer membrane protein [bacterium]
MTSVGRVMLGLLAAATLVISVGCGGPRIGVVDSQRILDESPLALTYQRELDSREKAMAEDLRLLVGRMAAGDLEARRQIYLRELSQRKGELEGKLNERIRKEVAEIARHQRLRFVLVKGATQLGGVDITQSVIDRLK